MRVADLEVSTREAHEGYIRRTIRPVLGEVRLRKLCADSLDSAVHGAEESAGGCPGPSITRTGRMPAMSGAGRCGITGPPGRTCVMSGAARTRAGR